MVKPPAVVFVVRHGARLDGADPQWHLTSPTPYDPPLTYGGWKQGQALGARIASIIQSYEESSNGSSASAANGAERDGRLGGGGSSSGGSSSSSSSSSTRKGLKRKHRVVVHSSPFLRCVQTSIAIASGCEAWKSRRDAEEKHSNAVKNHHQSLRSAASPRLRSYEFGHGSPLLTAIPEPTAIGKAHGGKETDAAQAAEKAERIALRLDAFLGEWLSPDYFENITPPPSSKMMLVAAKAELMRRGDPLDAGASMVHGVDASQGTFPGGWSSPKLDQSAIRDSAENSADEGATGDDLGHNLPKLGRANTFSIFKQPARRPMHLVSSTRDGGQIATRFHGYIIPTPSYALSAASPIPQGYVAHARDACVQIDYSWDSMRSPLDWGNGGEYGEEWSAMHRRFRHGLQEMILYYSRPESAVRLGDGKNDEGLRSLAVDSGEDDEVETILVLVTHGAGCNALIGALTSQPVLIDVGMGSLTMATRKSVDYKRFSRNISKSSSSPTRQRRGSTDAGPSANYEIKFTASMEHLRPGSPFLDVSLSRLRSDTLPVREKSPYRYERNVSSPTNSSHQRSTHSSVHLRTSSESSNTTTSNGYLSPDLRKTEGSFEEDSSSRTSFAAPATAGFSESRGLWTKPTGISLPLRPAPPTKAYAPHISSPLSPNLSSNRGTATSTFAIPPDPTSIDGAVDTPLDATRHINTSSPAPQGDGSVTPTAVSFASGKRPVTKAESYLLRDRSRSRDQRREQDSSVVKGKGLWSAEPRALATVRDKVTPKRRWTLGGQTGQSGQVQVGQKR